MFTIKSSFVLTVLNVPVAITVIINNSVVTKEVIAPVVREAVKQVNCKYDGRSTTLTDASLARLLHSLCIESGKIPFVDAVRVATNWPLTDDYVEYRR